MTTGLPVARRLDAAYVGSLIVGLGIVVVSAIGLASSTAHGDGSLDLRDWQDIDAWAASIGLPWSRCRPAAAERVRVRGGTGHGHAERLAVSHATA
jgi:hypothetical protein